MKFLRQLYFSFPSFLFWINRGIYLGIIAAGVYYYDQFIGELNLLYDVAPTLIPVTIMGLIFYELGVWAGWRLKKPRLRHQVDWFQSRTNQVPLLLWMMGLFFSLALFALQGIPILGDPNSRASLGSGLGVLKRFMTVFLPISTLELYAFYLNKYSTSRFGSWKSIFFILGNLAILLLLTAKAPFFFFAIFLLIIYLKYRPIASRRLFKRLFNSLRLIPLVGLFVFVLYLYAIYAADFPFALLISARLTTQVAQMPNYILWGFSGVPSASDLILNNIASVFVLLHIPILPVVNLEQVISGYVLKRPAIVGGLGPTVIGEGWILGGWVGVALLSLFWGYLSGTFVKRLVRSTRPMEVAVSIYAAFAIFYATQFFSVGVFLDIGISIISYILLHWLLYKFIVSMNRRLDETELARKAFTPDRRSSKIQ